jgi:hypothetical protein
MKANEYVWSFYHPNIADWMSKRAAASSSIGSAQQGVPFSYTYQFPPEIWITKDIRYQLANYGCVQFDWLQRKYHAVNIMKQFQQEIEFVLNQGWMEWKANQRLCLKSGCYEYLAHIRALFSDSMLLENIVQMYSNAEYVDRIYTDRQRIERIYQQA